MFFVFLTMSAIVSTLQEVVAQTIRARSRTLQKCIRQMLHDDVYKNQIYERFFRHPRIALPGRAVNQLTNIDPEDFAVAMATAVQPDDSPDDCITELPASVRALKDGALKQRLRLAMPDVFRDGADPDLIKQSVTAWYNASMNKTMEIYKSETRMRLYFVAAVATVMLNVSPIKIAQALQSQPELRAAFASAVPELSTMVLNFSDNASARISSSPQQDGGPDVQTLTSDLPAGDVQTMLAIFECTRGRTGLPIGWPWMAEAFDQIGTQASTLLGSSSKRTHACGTALATAQMSENLKSQLTMLNLSAGQTSASVANAETVTEPPASAPTPQPVIQPAAPTTETPDALATEPAVEEPAAAATLVALKPTPQQIAAASAMFTPQYGPTFATDPWWMVLLGWLVMVVAAGQGAPFWFNLLQKMVSRK
jgi:hypothetical protein